MKCCNWRIIKHSKTKTLEGREIGRQRKWKREIGRLREFMDKESLAKKDIGKQRLWERQKERVLRETDTGRESEIY
jgi:hypothetical protein